MRKMASSPNADSAIGNSIENESLDSYQTGVSSSFTVENTGSDNSDNLENTQPESKLDSKPKTDIIPITKPKTRRILPEIPTANSSDVSQRCMARASSLPNNSSHHSENLESEKYELFTRFLKSHAEHVEQNISRENQPEREQVDVSSSLAVGKVRAKSRTTKTEIRLVSF